MPSICSIYKRTALLARHTALLLVLASHYVVPKRRTCCNRCCKRHKKSRRLLCAYRGCALEQQFSLQPFYIACRPVVVLSAHSLVMLWLATRILLRALRTRHGRFACYVLEHPLSYKASVLPLLRLAIGHPLCLVRYTHCGMQLPLRYRPSLRATLALQPSSTTRRRYCTYHFVLSAFIRRMF